MNEKKRKDRCETCKFWDEGGSLVEGHGECHRNAPSPLLDLVVVDHNSSYAAFWPDTGPNDWCGEWKPLQIGIPVKTATALTADQCDPSNWTMGQ